MTRPRTASSCAATAPPCCPGSKPTAMAPTGCWCPGPSPAARSPGISTTGNHSYGVSMAGQNHVDISGLTLAGDQAGGLELSRDSDSQVHNISTAAEPNGVFLHINSTNVVLAAITVTGGRTGILVEKTTTGLHVTASTIAGVHVAGMEIGGHDTRCGLGRQPRRDPGRTRRRRRDRAQADARRVGPTGWSPPVAHRASWSTTCLPMAWATTRSAASARACRSPAARSAAARAPDGPVEAKPIWMPVTCGGLQVRAGCAATDSIMLDTVGVDTVSVGVEPQPGSVVTLRNSVDPCAASRTRNAHPCRHQRSAACRRSTSWARSASRSSCSRSSWSFCTCCANADADPAAAPSHRPSPRNRMNTPVVPGHRSPLTRSTT